MSDDLIFCGGNRVDKLEVLTDQHDAVARAAASAGPKAIPAAPIHKIILVEAERGLGKTRLVQEFYRRLAAAQGADGYWPPLDDLAEMPDAQDCDFGASPGFLWWGMAVSARATAGNTVFGALNDLFPHLTSAALAARRRDRGRAAARELADLATELGLPLAEAALEVTGLGTVKRFGEAAWDIGRILRDHAGDARDPAAEGRARREGVIDSVLADLGRLLSPRSRLYAGLPLILFIDDAQFADRDPALAAFVERLIFLSAQERWPLILVLTHWSRQLRDWRDAAGARHGPSRVAEVLHHARHGGAAEPGPYAGVPGGRLQPGNFVTVDLGAPVDDLTPAARGRFPGLAAGDIALLVEKAQGNPRKLEQMLARMTRKPRWFQDDDRAGGLSDTGREAVRAMADLPIEEIVLDRFADTPAEVRAAIMIAALFGPRFVVELVDRLSHARRRAGARDALEEGERQYRLLRAVADRGRNDIAFFAEGLFHGAARTYRESGMAKAELPDWPSDSVLLDALDALLAAIVDDPEKAVPGLGPDDMVEALTLAADRMAACPDPSAVSRAGLALAHLVRVEGARDNDEGAYDAARRFDAGFARGAWLIDAVPPFLADGVAAALQRLGDLAGVARIWEALHARLAEEAEADPSNMDRQRDLSVSHIKLGDMHAARGAGDLALTHYEAAFGIAKRLASHDSSNTGWQHDLSVSHERLGAMHAARGSGDLALRHHEAALGIRERLASHDPSHTGWQRDLSVSHNRLGDMHAARGSGDLALMHYEAALGIAERLASRDPSNTEWQHDLSVSHEKLGDVHGARGSGDLALRHHEAALGIRERLASRDPSNTDWQRDLSVSHSKLGDVHVARGSGDLALRHHEAALGIRGRLASHDPSNTGWQRDLSISHIKLGDVHGARGSGDLALRHHEAALGIAERLTSHDPSNTGWQRDLSVSHSKLGDVHGARGSGDLALRHYEAALGIAERLASHDPSHTGWQRDLSISHIKLGVVHGARGSGDLALRHHEAALGIAERLTSHDPSNMDWQRDLIISWVRIAEAGRDPVAHYGKALALCVAMDGAGHLAGRDRWMVEELRRRLAAARDAASGDGTSDGGAIDNAGF